MNPDDEIEPFVAACFAEFERVKTLQPYVPPQAPTYQNVPVVNLLQPPAESEPHG